MTDPPYCVCLIGLIAVSRFPPWQALPLQPINERASEASAAAAVGSVSDQHAHFREDEGEGEREEEKRWKGEALKERLTMQRGI